MSGRGVPIFFRAKKMICRESKQIIFLFSNDPPLLGLIRFDQSGRVAIEPVIDIIDSLPLKR
ncbi:MAG: hypothetical protein A2Z39_05210 [Deltaproteobacteria bacterium RBG_19FT_COMBO_46_9]|nr:MAG: hypothetical protein A2Z39_05210 [Deltaproteobacteria bacterium RBG_19FT_COMBO_46_9]